MGVVVPGKKIFYLNFFNVINMRVLKILHFLAVFNKIFYTMGTGSFPKIKWPFRGIDLPLPSRAEVNDTVDLHL